MQHIPADIRRVMLNARIVRGQLDDTIPSWELVPVPDVRIGSSFTRPAPVRARPSGFRAVLRRLGF